MSASGLVECGTCRTPVKRDPNQVARSKACYCSRSCRSTAATIRACSIENIAARFWSKVDKNGPLIREELGPCWVWTGALADVGYGNFGVRWSPEESHCTEHSHRAGWFLQHGSWPTLWVLHKCDNRQCVRASHLFEGTPADNGADCVSKGRHSRVLTDPEILEMRAMYARGVSKAELGRRFGITDVHAGRIVMNRSWQLVG